MSDTITIYRSNAGLGCGGAQPANLPPGVRLRSAQASSERLAGPFATGGAGRFAVAAGSFAAILLSAYGLAKSR